jgi:hypothetical protein
MAALFLQFAQCTADMQPLPASPDTASNDHFPHKIGSGREIFIQAELQKH